MKITLKNLEKLVYRRDRGEWQDKKWKNIFYIYKESCKNCGEPFLIQKRANGEFCSHSCRSSKEFNANHGGLSDEHKRKIGESRTGKKYPREKDKNKYETQICFCGKEFTTYKCNKRKYCSLKCANKAIGKEKKEKRIELICEYCGKKYKVISSRFKKSKYCSKKCKDIHVGIRQAGKGNPNYKEKITLICLNCNKEYKVHDYIKNTSKFCQKKCKDEYQKESEKGDGNPNFGNRKYTDLEYKNWQEYCKKVRAETSAVYKFYKNKINPENLEIGIYKYHLDHKYSVHDGFQNDIPIEIISHPMNLQILFCKDNLKKQTNSSITLNELKELIGEII